MGASEAEVRPQTILIDKEGANKLIELLKLPGSNEVIDYALEKMESIKKDYPELYAAFESLKKDADLAGKNPDDIWHGEKAQTVFQQFQSALLDKAKDALEGLLDGKSVQMLFAMNDKSEFLRGYVVDGKLLNANDKNDKSQIDNLDILFNAVLAKNNLISKDGSIFKSDEHGHIEKVGKQEKGAAGNVVEDKVKTDLAKELKDVDFDMVRREFPQKAAASAEKPAAPAAGEEKPSAAKTTPDKGPSGEEGPAPT